jgi:hypothetical protein
MSRKIGKIEKSGLTPPSLERRSSDSRRSYFSMYDTSSDAELVALLRAQNFILGNRIQDIENLKKNSEKVLFLKIVFSGISGLEESNYIE